jgi:hypothetical protein
MKTLQIGDGFFEDGFDAITGFKQKYQGERHVPGYNYLGPGTRLDIRLSGDVPKHGESAINDLDATALIHDVAYRDAGREYDRTKDRTKFTRQIHQADNAFIKNAYQSKDAPATGVIVSNIMEKKRNAEILGLLDMKTFSGRGVSSRKAIPKYVKLAMVLNKSTK